MPYLRYFTVLAAILALPVGTASGAPSIKKSIWGPVERDGVSQMPIYEELGVGILQMGLNWSQVAPNRPANPRDPFDAAYHWPAEIDRAVTEGDIVGIKVALLVAGTPRWANGGRDQRWAPSDPRDFADFLEAASRRWPQIHHWLVWGEPTKAKNFQPLRPDNGKPLRSVAALRGPRTYARLLDTAYGRLKSVSGRNLVVGGNSYTVGTVAPLRWIKALRLRNGRPPRMDLYGHNPFSIRKPNLRVGPLGRGFADISDLDTLARHIDANLRRDRSRPGPRIFISEYSVPTDHRNHEFNFYVGRRTQAEWIGAALRITRSFRRIYTFGYLGLYDDPVRSDGQQVERGLLERDGTHKLAFSAYRNG